MNSEQNKLYVVKRLNELLEQILSADDVRSFQISHDRTFSFSNDERIVNVRLVLEHPKTEQPDKRGNC